MLQPHSWSGAATWTAGDEFVNNGILFRYYDAVDQVEANIDLIAAEAVYRMDRNFHAYIPAAVDSDRGADSQDLLLVNLDFIANEAYERIGPYLQVEQLRQIVSMMSRTLFVPIAYNLKYGSTPRLGMLQIYTPTVL